MRRAALSSVCFTRCFTGWWSSFDVCQLFLETVSDTQYTAVPFISWENPGRENGDFRSKEERREAQWVVGV